MCKRGGCSATFDELNNILQFQICRSHRDNTGTVFMEERSERRRLMKKGNRQCAVLREIWSFLMKSIALGKEAFGLPEKEKKVYTSFINP